MKGVIPFPFDFETSFKMEFIEYTADPSDPPGPSKNWSSIGKMKWDLPQIMFCTPPTESQVEDIGMTGPTPVKLTTFTVTRKGESAVLRWRVADATGHAGFHVYRETAGTDRVRVTQNLLTGRREYEFVDPTAPQGAVSYWLKEVGRSGAVEWLGPVILAAEPRISPGLILSPAWPNPFQTATTINFSLGTEGRVRLSVFDIRGALVRTLVDDIKGPGEHVATWDGHAADGRRVAFGQYLVRLEAGNQTRVQKVLFLR